MQTRNYHLIGIYILVNIISIIGISNKTFAQCTSLCGPNLINNSSFESTTNNCGTANSEIFTDYSQVQDWFGTACATCPGNGSTPDYYNSSCTGAAATENCGYGTGSVGFFTSADVGGSFGSNAREYVQTQLATPLVAGQEYCATIQVKTSPGSIAYVPTDGLGLWFTNDMVDIDVDNGGQQFLGPGSIVNATPQIQNAPGNLIGTTCTTITGSFIATGTETWMVMGNFLPDNQIQTNASCSGLFTFCFGYLIVDQVELVAVCSSCDAAINASGPLCVNDAAFNLTAATPGGTWSGPGITDANLGTFDPAIAGVGTHQITYDLTCGDDDMVTITVNDLDDPTFSYDQASYCHSAPNPIPTITGLAGGTFSIDAGGVVDPSTGQIDIQASGNGNYVVTYTTNGSCPNSSTFNVSIIAMLDATIDPAGPFCEYDNAINLSAGDQGGIWSGNGITDVNNGIFDPSVAGLGTHSITYDLGCGDTDTEDIIVYGVDNSTSVNGLTITANAAGANYQWLDCKDFSPISGETSQTFTATSNGNYAVIVTENSCSDTSDCVTIAIVTIGDDIYESEINIYPNPTNNTLFISGLEEVQGDIRYSVFDNLGRLVLQGNIADQTMSINCTELVSGLYTIQIINENNTYSLQFFKN
ncbi:MAG: T9SS type A sorting domain-containing protein [Crocinitomicaceae bacterium]